LRPPSYSLFFFFWLRRPLRSTLFPYTTLFRSRRGARIAARREGPSGRDATCADRAPDEQARADRARRARAADRIVELGWSLRHGGRPRIGLRKAARACRKRRLPGSETRSSGRRLGSTRPGGARPIREQRHGQSRVGHLVRSTRAARRAAVAGLDRGDGEERRALDGHSGRPLADARITRLLARQQEVGTRAASSFSPPRAPTRSQPRTRSPRQTGRAP